MPLRIPTAIAVYRRCRLATGRAKSRQKKRAAEIYEIFEGPEFWVGYCPPKFLKNEWSQESISVQNNETSGSNNLGPTYWVGCFFINGRGVKGAKKARKLRKEGGANKKRNTGA